MGTLDIVVVGGGIAGSALAAVLARKNIPVAVLERDIEPVDRVRGEYMTPWGVIELKRLALLDTRVEARGLFSRINVPYDENFPGVEALPYTVRFSDRVGEVVLGI